jgi:hypothetical protein
VTSAHTLQQLHFDVNQPAPFLLVDSAKSDSIGFYCILLMKDVAHTSHHTKQTIIMYRPQHSKQRRSTSPEDTDDDASTTLTTTTMTTAAAPTHQRQPSSTRRRSTVDTPYNPHMTQHSQSEPASRKSWAETDWEELEKLWNSRHFAKYLSDRDGHRAVEEKNSNAASAVRAVSAVENNNDDDDDDLFLQFFQKRFEEDEQQQLKESSLNDNGKGELCGVHNSSSRSKPWRRRVTI